MELLQDLPLTLAERCRVVSSRNAGQMGEFVVYWMRTAMRLDENPALDVAKTLSVQLKKPLLIYQGLSQRYPFASDRHHTFILQGARDVQRACKEAGLSYAFHLETSETETDALRLVAEQAALVVTEDMPTDPSLRFQRALLRNRHVNLIAVDTSCVFPMRLVGRAYTRAFEFRRDTARQYAIRVSRNWPDCDARADHVSMNSIPFQCLDFAQVSIADLVSKCRIDHTVSPVMNTIGGSEAGYQRWYQFSCGRGLKDYAKLRNLAEIESTSRMSAYLHYGMVSPFRLAREASDMSCDGAEKFLDELLIWREMSYAFCFYRTDHAMLSAIPEWARATLSKHEADAREHLYDWETLSRGNTDDELWNAAQRSLLLHGELHNNLRMTWGKMLVNWTSDAKSALKMIVDLNHRYALDGRDPNSYGGILWCLGQFDRPFAPETRIFGSVRSRSTQEHRKRINLDQYVASVNRIPLKRPPSVAVIGAGISGAIAARILSDAGLTVKIFEKSSKVGGRMATKDSSECHVDHGAQYFTAKTDLFRRYLNSWIKQGRVARWDARIAVFEGSKLSNIKRDGIDRFVGVPTMRAICEHLTEGLAIDFESRVMQIEGEFDKRLRLESGDCTEPFDYVISSAPAPQSASIYSPAVALSQQLHKVRFQPCWAMLVALKSPCTTEFDAAFVNSSIIRWLAWGQSKPGRKPSPALAVHAAFDWSETNIEASDDFVIGQLSRELQRIVSINLDDCERRIHRWKYAASDNHHPELYYSNGRGLIACGDWAAGAKVEGAFLSGCAAAGHVLRSLSREAKK